jgi:hypothetical protein
LAVVALIGFVVVYYQLLATKWTKERTPPIPQQEYLASALAGLVGGIVAAAFGQKLPKPLERNRAAERLNAFGRFLIPWDDAKLRELLAAAYALVYIGMSVWAIVVWAKGGEYMPKLISSLAVVSIGLFIAIITAYFNGTN